jgi:translocation protein SEC63
MNSLLAVSLARNWLSPSLAAMRLSAHLSQALPLSAKTGKEADQDYLKFAQLPGIQLEDASSFKHLRDVDELVKTLEASSDGRAPEIRKAVLKWGRIEIVDASFKGRKCHQHLSFLF